MAALRDMAVNLMIKRAIAAAEPMLPPAHSKPTLSDAELHAFCRQVLVNYAKQKQVVRITGLGLAGVVGVALAGFGIHRFNSTSIPRDD